MYFQSMFNVKIYVQFVTSSVVTSVWKFIGLNSCSCFVSFTWFQWLRHKLLFGRKIYFEKTIFSQEQGLLIISSFDQQNLYLLTKLWPKQCRQHSISCPKYFIDYFTNYSFRHVADFASAWICNYFYFVIEGIALFKGKLESWTCFC